MRILVGECKQEISSFNPVLSHYEDFTVQWGEDILRFHRGGVMEMAGALSVFDAAPGIEIVPTYSARARTSAGTLAGPDFRRIANEFLTSVSDMTAVTPVDGVYLSLHGAMASEDEPDPEGYLLSQMRAILGEEMPIVISLDLHGVVTDRMLQHIDALTMFHTYPHQDFFETGERAANLLLRIMDGQVRPLTARVFMPALVRGNELITETGLLGRFVRQAQTIESGVAGLSAAINIGNPFTDVPELGSNALITVDADALPDAVEVAEAEAVTMAEGFWAVRERLQAPLVPIDEAVRQAQEGEGTTILTDAADATSSGASGDSNAILAALVRAGFSRPALAPIVDAPAVRQAAEAGIGATIDTTLGGSLDPRFEPLPVRARVRMLSDGRYHSEYSGAPVDAGPCAVLEIGAIRSPITVVVTTRSVGLTDRSLFLAHDLDPQRFDAIVVKSPHCRYEYFDAWAARNLNVDAPGSTSANLPTLGHTVVRRPIFPLDEGVTFMPKVQIYQRRTG
jgi:microcystin degradation protein MlrC